jgi:hypothetical protein
MPELPSSPAIVKLHEALNSLNVTLTYIQLSQRQLHLRERSTDDDQLMSRLLAASNRLLVAAVQLRDAEAILTAEPQLLPEARAKSHIDGDGQRDGAASTEPDTLEREDEDLFFDSEEGSDY